MTNKIDSSGSQTKRELPQPFSSLIDVDVFGTSHRGRIRKTNDDRFLVLRCGRALETVSTNLSANQPGTLFEETGYGMVVADGVGEGTAGKVASETAIAMLLNLALRTPDWHFRWGPKERNTVMWRMQDRLRNVNEVIAERAAEDASLKGMTSTMTVALSHGRDLILSHVGDSRAYLLRNGKISRLTRDHTLAERLLDEGFAREDDELLKEFKDILIQSLGIDQIDCRPEVQHYVLQSGDQLLLCTDGLTDLVSDNEIEAVLKRHANAENSCRELVALALDKGGEDNITAVVARYWIPKTEAGNKET